jgi:uncharacterized protein YcbX
MFLSGLNIYPIKSLKGISLEDSHVENRGLRFDRRWMLVDTDWQFFTQREFPVMATIRTELHEGGVRVSKNGESMVIAPEPDRGERGIATVWNSRVDSIAYRGPVSEWFSDAIGTKCMLVLMPDSTRRQVNLDYAVHAGQDIVSFADGYPFMLIGDASLDDLNQRLADKYGDSEDGPALPLAMNRFRPNCVVKGSDPFEEDTWRTIRIGETTFHVVKPCVRCIITTTDQETGERGKEPLKTLAEYRGAEGKVQFGQNLIAQNPGGQIYVGDEVEILARK